MSKPSSPSRVEPRASQEPVAIVGAACRYPGANSYRDFARLLLDARSGVRTIPKDRWDIAAAYDPDPSAFGKMVTRWGGILDDVASFDGRLFRIGPREAVAMDPQQRMLLEVVWAALENAGIAPMSLAGSNTAVIVGACTSDYQVLHRANADTWSYAYASSGTALSIIAGRISFFFDLRGPSYILDTACSSSLVALDCGYRAVAEGRCDTAIVAGVSLTLDPGTTVSFSKLGMMAPDGQCKTFDQSADGYVRADGVAVVVLKRLADAKRDRHTIGAEVRGSCVVHDGASITLTAPSVPAQVRVIRQALTSATVEPVELSALELHGTGTALGDPLEAHALAEVFGRKRADRLLAGSVKTNIGHAEGAAGLAGLLKLQLSMENEEFAPHRNLSTLNRMLDVDSMPVVLPGHGVPWVGSEKPLVAGVSSFGFSGTSAHAVLRRADTQRGIPVRGERACHVFVLSANSKASLAQLARRVAAWIVTHPGERVADVCYSAVQSRGGLPFRLATVVGSLEELSTRLEAYASDGAHPAVFDGHAKKAPRTAFIFGDADVDAAAGRELGPSFRERAGARWDEPKRELVGTSPERRLAYFTVLAECLTAWGVDPAVVCGVAAGELGAMAFSGALDPEAAALAAHRPNDAVVGRLPKRDLAWSDTGEFVRSAAEIATRGRPGARPPRWEAVRTLLGKQRCDHVVAFGLDGDVAARELGSLEVMSAPRGLGGELATILDIVARLYVAGGLINADELDRGYRRLRRPLPEYAFDKTRYWLDTTTGTVPLPERGKASRVASSWLKEVDVALAEGTRIFQAELSAERLPWLADHRVQGVQVFPGMGYLELCLSAMRAQGGAARVALEDVELAHALFVRDDESRLIQLTLEPVVAAAGKEAPPGLRFRALSRGADGRWGPHTEGRVVPYDEARTPVRPPEMPNRNDLATRFPKSAEGEEHYAKMTAAGNEYGVRFRGVDRVYYREGEAVGVIKIPAVLRNELGMYVFHPAVLDACGQVFLWCDPDAGLFMPTKTGRLVVHAPPSDRLWVHALLSDRDRGRARGDLYVYDDSGQLVLSIERGQLDYLRAASDPSDPVRRFHVAWSPVREAEGEEASPAPKEGWLCASAADASSPLADALAASGVSLERFRATSTELRADLAAAASRKGVDGILVIVPPRGTMANLATPFAEVDADVVLAAARACRDAGRRLVLVTHGAEQVVPDDDPDLAVAGLSGLACTLRAELVESPPSRLDLPAVADPVASARVVRRLLGDSALPKVLALREGKLFAPHFEPDPALARTHDIACRSDRTYLVTGGLGALGVETAKRLVDRGARHLVLVSRTARGDESELVGSIAGRTSEAVTVEVTHADVSVPGSVAPIFTDAEARGWPVAGVVHAAGAVDLQPWEELTGGSIRATQAAKIVGAFNLHRATEHLALDFFVLFSSISSVLPSRRLAAYAAANAFLDALAAHRRRRGLVATSMRWGAWKDIGMAARARSAWTESASRGASSLEAEAALDAMERAIAGGSVAPVVFAATGEELKVLSTFDRDLFSSVAPQSASGDAARGAFARELSALPEGERPARLLGHVRASVAQSLNLAPDDVDVDVALTSLGLDSLMAIDLRTKLEEQLDVEIPVVALLKGPTLQELTAELLKRLGQTQRKGPEVETRTHAEFPLSFGQRGIWFLSHFAPKSPAYNVAAALRLDAFDRPALDAAFQAVVDRHPSLRTVFFETDGVPHQRVLSALELRVGETDARGWTEEDLRTRLTTASEEPFDLKSGPLVRVHLYTCDDGHRLLVVAHHIVIDFWSLVILMTELGEQYAASSAGRPAVLPKPMSTYSSFVEWQTRYLEGERGRSDFAYWSDVLAGARGILSLPIDRPRPPVQTFAGRTFEFELPQETVSGLRALAEREQVTLYVTLLAIFNVLLHRLTGQDDFVVATLATGRTRRVFERVVGYFVNTTPVRAHIEREMRFTDVLGATRTSVLGALDHQDLPFARLIESLPFERNPSYAPLCQALFVLQKAQLEGEEITPFIFLEDGAEMNLGGLRIRSMGLERRAAQFDLLLVMAEVTRGVRGQFQFNADLFDIATIERFSERFAALAASVARDPASTIAALDYLSRAERSVLDAVGAASVDPEATELVPDLLRQQVERTPNEIAVVAGTERLTFRELDRRASDLADELRAKGVGPDVVVGILLPRSTDLVVAIVAVLAAGGAYLPLDPEYPPARVAMMLDRARARVVVTNRETGRTTQVASALFVEDVRSRDDAAPRGDRCVAPEDLAYVLFTSGSTGTPKAVGISHASIANHMAWMRRTFPLSSDDAVYQKTTVSFDASVWELLLPLLTGARLVLASRDAHRDAALMCREMARERVTVAQFVPRVLTSVVDEPGFVECRDLRWIFSGGEALSAKLRDRVHERGCATLVNLYGPTEATIDATYWICARDDASAVVPIGRPVDGVRAYVVDAYGQPVPLGAPGELWLGGRQLARGYLHDPAQTAERFVGFETAGSHARAYRTGDRVRMRADGALEYLGRCDEQLKVSGVRCEPEEIEAALRSHPAVEDAGVVLRIAGEEEVLVAFVVFRSEVTSSDLKRHLASRLPDQLVPGRIVGVERLPTQPNGKLARRELAQMSTDALESRAPAVATPDATVSDTERRLATIWGEILNVPEVARHDDFFDLGGHSLLAMRMMPRVREEFGVELEVSGLFEAATLERFAALVERAAAAQRTGEARAEGPAARVVTLSEGGDRGELNAIIHSSSGTLTEYVRLARAWDGARVVGIERSAPLDETDLTALAKSYADLLLASEPSARIRVIGWSIAGVLALETARVLLASDRLKELVLLDTVNPQELASWFAAAGDEDRRRLFATDLALLNPPASPDAAADGGVEPSELERRYRIYESTMLLLSRYQPRPFTSRVRFVRPAEGPVTEETWGAVFAGGVDVTVTNAGHHDMLRHPHVEQLSSMVVGGGAAGEGVARRG